MSLDEIAAEAANFLTFYVEGNRNASVLVPFPDASDWSGIFLRVPATLGEPPNYAEQEISLLDEQCFAAGEGPEACSSPYVYVDMCPIARVNVTHSGGVMAVVFDAVVDFPAIAFPRKLSQPPSDLASRRILLPAAMGECNQIAEECINRLREFLRYEYDQLIISYEVRLLRFEDHNGALT
jgi:hypothetical protein